MIKHHYVFNNWLDIKTQRGQLDQVGKDYLKFLKGNGKHFWIGHLKYQGQGYGINYPVSWGIQQCWKISSVCLKPTCSAKHMTFSSSLISLNGSGLPIFCIVKCCW